MKRYRWTRWIMISSLILLPLLTTGCGLFKSDEAGSIDPPQDEAVFSDDIAAEELDANGEPLSQAQITLYFKDQNGFVAPVGMHLPRVERIATQSLEYMVEGGPAQGLLPEGFTALLPQGTEIKGMDIVKGKKLAIVDFSKEFVNYNPQDERKILEAITWTLTGFPTIDQVEIWVEGKALHEMPMDGTPLDEPLTRAMGINIETSDGVHLGQASPVTLYFLNETADDFQYFVPVTRMIQQTEDMAAAAVTELISGPQQNSPLAETIFPTAKLLEVQMTEDLITVNFDESILSEDQKAPAQALQSVILSLTESTGASKVQIKVNGQAKIDDTDNKAYSVPVTKPNVINPYTL